MTMYNVEKSRVNVNMKGEGEPILFLHGVPDTSEVWDGAIAAFSDKYQCIAPDLPGFGRTQAPRNFEYSLENLANFIDQLLSSLSVAGGVHMVIHDIGGVVGLAFAIDDAAWDPWKGKNPVIHNRESPSKLFAG